jgi:membrane protein implicated in regulation of membrane protease activity
MTAHSNDSAQVPTWFSILVAIILLAILVIFGDLFVFILGALGVIIAFAANYVDKDAHH